MAISPHQLTEKFQQDVDYFEKVIDENLSKMKLAPGSSVSIPPPPSMGDAHFKVIRDRYIKAGWDDIKLSHDQRDGSYITFISPRSDRKLSTYVRDGW